jgi:glycosyltransferase involved in cell wall biosynthesis
VLVRNEREIEALENIRPYCAKIKCCIIKRSSARNAIDAAGSVVRRKSFIVSRDDRTEMRENVIESLREGQDLIYVDHLQVFQYVPETASTPILLDEHNVEWRIIERFARPNGSRRSIPARAFARIEWPKLRDYELHACARADHVLTVTEQDRAIISFEGIPQEKVTSLPIGVDIDHFKQIDLDRSSTRVISIGTMSWPPNADSASFFCSEIYPAVKKAVGSARFSIVGANPPPDIVAFGRNDRSIEVTGFVDDIREEAKDAAVFVVPLRVGSGMRVKILDAMAMGLPIVTTSIGCEGIGVRDGEHVLIADTPQEFSDAVIRLLGDPEERTRIAAAGRRLVESSYSWPPILSKLDSTLENLIRRNRGNA